MKKTITYLALMLSTFSIYAQDPNILWQRTIGGDRYDGVEEVRETPDGGYILGGASNSDISGEKTENSKGDFDMWIMKIDTNGEIEWQKTIGGNAADDLHSIELTPDGGYIATGESISNISGDKTENSRGSYDFWIVKLDASGNIEWDKTLGGTESEGIPKIRVINDGYYICGYSTSNISGEKTEDAIGEEDYWLLRLDNSGNISWQKTIGGSGSDYIESISETTDGGCVIGGSSNSNISGSKTENSFGNYDYWVVKIDSSGNIEWDKTFGGTSGDKLHALIQTSDNGYLLAGESSSDISGNKSEDSKGFLDFWIVKLAINGIIEWQNTIGGELVDRANSVFQTSDGGYIIGGSSNSDMSGDKNENGQGGGDYWVVKLNNVGLIEWQNTIGGSDFDKITSIIQTSDNNYLIAGNSRSDISGDKTENSRGQQDFWIIKHDSTLGLAENPFTTAITLYPNPTKNTLQLNTKDKTIDQVNIYTMTGSKVLQWNVNNASPSVDVSSLASGIYYVQLYSGKNVALKKFVKE